jgi:DNA-binding CsgD family transcriptional regulator
MLKELTLKMINERLLLELTLTLIAYYLTWLVTVALGFRIVGVKFESKKILPWVLIASLYSLLIKPFIPMQINFIIIIAVIILPLRIGGKVKLIKAFWAAFLVLLAVLLGTILIESPLCSLGKSIVSFFYETVYGNIVGTLIEVLFPSIILFILSALNISLVPPFGRKLNLHDLINVYIYGALCFWIYISFLRYMKGLESNPKQIFTYLSSEWIGASVALAGFYIYQTNILKRYSERQRFASARQKFHKEKTDMKGRFVTEITTLEEKITELDELNTRLMDKKLGPEEVVDFSNKLKSFSDLVIQNMQRIDNLDEDYNFDDMPEIKFTRREKDVLRLIAKGESNEKISEVLVLSLGRVTNIVAEIKSKTELPDRYKLIVYAIYWVKKNKK